MVNNISNGFPVGDLHPFPLEGRGLVPPHEKMEAEEFWNALKDYLKEDLYWQSLTLGDMEFSRESLSFWVQVNLPIPPEELKKLHTSISSKDLEELATAKIEPIYKAVYIGSKELCEKFIRDGCDLHAACKGEEAKSFEHFTLLSMAFFLGDDDLFYFLVDEGADIRKDLISTSIFFKRKKGVYEKKEEFIPLLIKHGLLEEEMGCDFRGYSSMHYAAARGDLKKLAFLLQCGVNLELPSSQCGETPLAVAVENENIKSICFLIEQGADPNQLNVFGASSLSTAVETKNKEAAALLLENGADPNLSKSFYQLPLYIAISGNTLEIVELLLSKGADFRKIDNWVDKGKNLFDHAIKKNNLPIIELLLKQGAEVEGQLFEAVKNKNLGIVPLLIAYASLEDLKAKNTEGLSFLHMAVILKKKEWIQQLLDRGVDVNTPTSTQITPLHLAAIRGYKEIVQFLLGLQADANSVDYTDNTPFHLVLMYTKTLPIANLLLDAGADPFLNSLGLYNKYKQARLSWLQEHVQKAKRKDPHLHLRWKELFLRKLCGHCFHIGGNSILTSLEGDQQELHPVTLEGFTSSAGFLKKVAKNTLKIKLKLPNKWAETVDSLCAFTANDHELNDSEYLARIQNGEPTLLLSGYWSHSIKIVIWEDLYIECDRRKGEAVEVFYFDPKKLTPERIGTLREARMQNNKYYDKIKDALSSELGFQENLQTQKIANACNSLPKQLIGNCQWANFEAAIFSIFASFSANAGVATQAFSLWQTFQQLTFFHQYLDFHLSGKSPFHPDYQLINSAVDCLKKIDWSKLSNLVKIGQSAVEKAEQLNNTCSLDIYPLPLIAKKQNKLDSLFANSQLIDTDQISYAKLYQSYFFK